ncbi:hypothetical protein ME793_16600 [Lactobacillus delbrueckii]|nr:hypothetical protein ME793_16600 [Lactobacillus delbrueckii]
MAEGIFQKDQIVSTKTLYNYVGLGLMDIKNIGLPEKVKCNTKTYRARVNKRILGRSIDERSPRIDTRKDFGHWECERPRMTMYCLLCVNERRVNSL